jgi:CDP-6-deoxy-D-xylo-4-hexulose-3-dehydrase
MIKLIKSTFHHEADTQKKLTEFVASAEIMSFGPECISFEKKFAKFQGRSDSMFLNSGSSANLAVVQALLNLGRLKQGDVVAFSALTWSTNVMPLIQLGLQALPVDVELDTLNVSSKTLTEALDRFPVKMLFLTNLLGFCDDIDEIQRICHDRDIILIEDNCESLGTVYKGKLLGNYSLASTFSFYVGHHMSTIEGGAICTDDEELANMVRLVRAHGWDRNLSTEEQTRVRTKFNTNSTFYSRYTFYELGYNLRPTEINGFLGNVQVEYLDEIIDLRRKNFFELALPIYEQKNRFYPIRYDHIELLSNFAVPVICRTPEIRDELVAKCEGRLEIRPVVGGDITQQPFFAKHSPLFANLLKDSNASLIHAQGLYFGNNPDMTAEDKAEIAEIFSAK